MMEPRGFFMTFLTMFFLTSLPFALVWKFVMDADPDDAAMVGILFGLMMAGIQAPFLMNITHQMPYETAEEFTNHLSLVMMQLNFQRKEGTGEILTYEAKGGASFSIGPLNLNPASFFPVTIHLGKNQATIIGPRMHISKLRKKL